MIRSFRHKGVECFFKSGSRTGIQAAHAPRLAKLGRPVKIMAGGITGWIDEGFELATSGSPA